MLTLQTATAYTDIMCPQENPKPPSSQTLLVHKPNPGPRPSPQPEIPCGGWREHTGEVPPTQCPTNNPQGATHPHKIVWHTLLA